MSRVDGQETAVDNRESDRPQNANLRRGGGRPAGVPNKATQYIKEFCRKIVEDPEYVARLFERAKKGKLHPSMETMLYYYAYGKPKDVVKHEGLSKPELQNLSDQEILEIELRLATARARGGNLPEATDEADGVH